MQFQPPKTPTGCNKPISSDVNKLYELLNKRLEIINTNQRAFEVMNDNMPLLKEINKQIGGVVTRLKSQYKAVTIGVLDDKNMNKQEVLDYIQTAVDQRNVSLPDGAEPVRGWSIGAR